MAGEFRLTCQERRRLQGITRSDRESGRARERATVILMSARGISASMIAETLGLGARTVHPTRRRWRRQAFDGLDDASRSGRPAEADKIYMRKLLRAVQTDSRTMGYAFTRWTCAKLADYMRQQTGVGLAAVWVSSLLKRNGFVWRKAKLTIRNLQNPRGKKARAETCVGCNGPP